MATDYEAVYESVMRYTQTSASDVDTQEKLARYLRQNDRQNKMTDKLIDRLVDTQNAKRDIENAKENNDFSQVRQRRIQRASVNDEKIKNEKYNLQKQGKLVKGTVTIKGSGDRKVVYKNRDDKLVYFDEKVQRAREVKVDDKGFAVGGRFAKR